MMQHGKHGKPDTAKRDAAVIREAAWQQSLDEARRRLHGGYDAQGRPTSTTTFQEYPKGTYERKAREIMKSKGFEDHEIPGRAPLAAKRYSSASV